MSETDDERSNSGRVSGAIDEHEWRAYLSEERCEIAFDVLIDSEAPIDLSELARSVSERQRDAGSSGRQHARRVAVSLHHNHLPRLSELDLIDYDHGSTRIEDCP
jgi:hypothetical protein